MHVVNSKRAKPGEKFSQKRCQSKDCILCHFKDAFAKKEEERNSVQDASTSYSVPTWRPHYICPDFDGINWLQPHVIDKFEIEATSAKDEKFAGTYVLSSTKCNGYPSFFCDTTNMSAFVEDAFDEACRIRSNAFENVPMLNEPDGCLRWIIQPVIASVAADTKRDSTSFVRLSTNVIPGEFTPPKKATWKLIEGAGPRVLTHFPLRTHSFTHSARDNTGPTGASDGRS